MSLGRRQLKSLPVTPLAALTPWNGGSLERTDAGLFCEPSLVRRDKARAKTVAFLFLLLPLLSASASNWSPGDSISRNDGLSCPHHGLVIRDNKAPPPGSKHGVGGTSTKHRALRMCTLGKEGK